MSDILGFAVLSGPLWLIVLWLPVSILVAVKLSKRFKPTATRIAMGIGIFLLAYLLPFADEIIGRMYFNYLCTHEAGVKVYQTVELPAEYWDEQGRARFIQQERSLEFDEKLLGNQYTRKSIVQSESRVFSVDRHSYQLFDTKAQIPIGENINFLFWGGWVAKNFTPHNSAISCDRQQVGYFMDVLKAAFKPARTK